MHWPVNTKKGKKTLILHKCQSAAFQEPGPSLSVNTFSLDEDKRCIIGSCCCCCSLHLPVDYNPVKFKSPDYVLSIDARSHAVYVTWYFDPPKFQVCPNPGFLFMGYSSYNNHIAIKWRTVILLESFSKLRVAG